MNRKNVLFASIFVFTFTFVCISNAFSQNKKSFHNQSQCSLVTNGFSLCSDISISASSGEDVIIGLSLKNESTEKLPIIKQGQSTAYDLSYSVRVTKENGQNVPRIVDVLSDKLKDGTATQEEIEKLGGFLPLNDRRNYGITIAPNETYSFKLNLSEQFDFTRKGKYHVQITRKVSNQNDNGTFDISLCKLIEVTVN